ncbi:MAG: SRPBCC family protein [Cyanobacteria bacterium J06623_7]
MTDWLEHTVQIEVPVPIELAWSLWSDLEQMTIWMKWIESVKILPEQPELSRWKLASGGFNFTWLSRIVQIIPQQVIEWQSVDGLPNKGAIRFYDRKEQGCIVKMSFAYAVPGIIGKLMDNLIGDIVESTVMADLERFKAYAIEQQNKA